MPKGGWRSTALLVLAAACGSSSPPAPEAPPPTTLAPAVPPVVSVRVNGSGDANVDVLCSEGVFVSTRVTNNNDRSIEARALAVRFEPTSGACAAHTVEFTPASVVPAHQDQEVRRFDAAGSLCAPPTGRPFCSWHATSTVTTDAGTASGSLDFRAIEVVAAPPVEAGCERTPVILTPRAGDVVSGVVGVTASVVESSRCVISARTIVQVRDDSGAIVATSSPIDLGDTFRWNTRSLTEPHPK
jgi:hypothetical protein